MAEHFENFNDAPIVAEDNDIWLLRLAAIEENENMIAAAVEDNDDHFSFEDSEQFEEDSLCSLPSESGSLNQKWRGWAPKNSTTLSSDIYGSFTSGIYNEIMANDDFNKILGTFNNKKGTNNVSRLCKLEEIAARKIAQTMSLEVIESTYKAIESKKMPDHLFLLISRQSFPESEKDISLYSCLENTHANQFAEGEQLYRSGAVTEIFQIGYHVSAVVHVFDDIGTPQSNFREFVACEKNSNERDSNFAYDVSIRVDKCKIISCKCSCSDSSSWCEHIVAVCLQRMFNVDSVQFRMTVWDSITSLEDTQVKKLTQYLINDLPRKYLPVAQKLIDELQDPNSEINASAGAPDPTADGHDNGLPALWCMNEKVLHDNIQKILINFVKPSPTVHCDVQYLSSSSPPASNEWNVLIRPLRSKDPEALWNLLSIVKEMLIRGDENVSNLLHIITEDCLRMETILIWWYQTTLTQSGFWHLASHKSHALHSHVNTTQHSAASLCDEIVKLWRLIALNPKFSAFERDQLASLLQLYHCTAVHRIGKMIKSLSVDNYYSQNIVDEKGCRLSAENASFTEHHFPGFFPALQACYMDWHGPEICQIVNELNFHQIYKILQLRKSSKSVVDVENQHLQCQNIPLLRYGAEALFKNIAENADQTTANCSLNNDSYEEYINENKSAYNSVASTSRKKTIKKKKNLKNKRQIGQQPSTSASCRNPSENRKIADSDDSVPDDADEDIDDILFVSKRDVSKKIKSKVIRREKNTEQLDELFASAHAEMNAFSIKFVCCEALLSHGYTTEAYKLARVLAQQLLENPPNLLPTEAGILSFAVQSFDDASEGCMSSSSSGDVIISKETLAVTTLNTKLNVNNASSNFLQKKSKSNCSHFKRSFDCDTCNVIAEKGGNKFSRHFTPPNIKRLKASELVAKTLSRTIFLVKILISTPQYSSNVFGNGRTFNSNALALELSLRIMRNPRGPAATKSLEVLIYYLEHELLALLHKIELNTRELSFIADFADDYLQSLKKTSDNRVIVPCLTMAHYILDALRQFKSLSHHDKLALHVALETLGMRVCISETSHPMLCECIRRQRGDLAMALILQNRDSIERLGVILDKVLDSAVHRMYNDQSSNAAFFLNQLDAHQTQQLQSSAMIGFSKAVEVKNPLQNDNKILKESVVKSIQTESSLKSDSSSQADKLPTSSNKGDVAAVFTEESSSELNKLNIKKQVSQHNINFNAKVAKEFLYNHATEAQAHFMVELAKRVLTEAGGNQSNTIFNSLNNAFAGPAMGNNAVGNAVVGGPHRYLHICSFLIGLYALGLNNSVSSTWPTRTYSTHVSWIQTQALEIGRSALQIVRRSWETHLTPTEVASLADKASISADPSVVEEGALLALSVLPKAYALTAIESKKALNQCKEQNAKLLEQACLAVEKAAEKDGVYPEVLFKVAHHWFNLHVESMASGAYKQTCSSTAAPSGNGSTESNSSASSSCSSSASHEHGTLQHQNYLQVPPVVNPVKLDDGLGNLHNNIVAHSSNQYEQQSSAGNLQYLSTQNSQISIPPLNSQHNSQQVMFHFAVAQHYHYQQNDRHFPKQLQQQHSAALIHSMNVMPTPHLMQVPHINNGMPLPISHGPLVYANVHPCSTSQLPQQNVHQQYATPSNPTENGARLHVSHSAPNLQPTGNFSHPPPSLMPQISRLSVIQPPPSHQPPSAIPPQLQHHFHGGWPQNSQIANKNFHKFPTSLPAQNMAGGIPMPIGFSMQPPPVQRSYRHSVHPTFYPNSLLPLPQQQQPLAHINGQVLPSHVQLFNQQHQQQMASAHYSATQSNFQQTIQQQNQQKSIYLSTFLINAHRVGMRAMDTMGLRNADDCRSFTKYSRTPMFCNEIRWLFEEVSVQLGGAFVHSFCEKVSSCVASPFLLFHLVKESIKYFHLTLPSTPPQMFNSRMPSGVSAGANLNINGGDVVKSCAMQVKNLMIQQMYPHSVAELMRNCIEMLYEAAFNKLHHSHFSDADIDDTCELVLTAREAFGFIPQNGKAMFDTFVRFARMQKACKKDVIQRVNEALYQKSDHHIDE